MGDYIERETVRVLREGLPPVPDVLERGQTIPLACWRGERSGAVLFVRRWKNGQIDTDTAIADRNGEDWDEPNGWGGGPWFDDPLVRGAEAPDGGLVSWSGSQANDSVEVFIGKAAASVAAIRVSRGETYDDIPIESPTGAVLVGVDGHPAAATWTPLDHAGNALEDPAGFDLWEDLSYLADLADTLDSDGSKDLVAKAELLIAKGPVDGIVKSFENELGWGVLTSPEIDGDVWIHVHAIQGSQASDLEAGQPVRFTYIEPPGGQDGFQFRAYEARLRD